METMKQSLGSPRDPNGIGAKRAGLSWAEAVAESGKCVQCGCISFDHCRLRIYAEQYQANAQRFKSERKEEVERIADHPIVVYEPGKCIKCGLCVRITEAAGEELGLAFVGRGFDVRVDPALNGNLKDALEKTALDCIAVCPSGALIHKDELLCIGSPQL